MGSFDGAEISELGLFYSKSPFIIFLNLDLHYEMNMASVLNILQNQAALRSTIHFIRH